MMAKQQGLGLHPKLTQTRAALVSKVTLSNQSRRLSHIRCSHACQAEATELDQQHQQASTSGISSAGPVVASLAATVRFIRQTVTSAAPHVRQLLLGPSHLPSTQQHATLSWLAAPLAVATMPGNGFADLLSSRVFMVGFFAWFTAQFLKIFTR